MTRESAEMFMFGLKNFQWLQHPLLYEHVDTGLGMIFSDIESKVCSNCKHYQEIDDLKYCYELDEYDMKYCDRFEKEDDGIKEDH